MDGWGGTIRPVEAADRGWIADILTRAWSAPIVVSRGHIHRPVELDGFIAEVGGKSAGLVTVHVEGAACEVVTLNSLEPGSGAGRALMQAAAEYARGHGCGKLWLITTNDNTHALRFYQRWGMRIAAVRPGAIDEARQLKPEISAIGYDGIPIRDEIELTFDL